MTETERDDLAGALQEALDLLAQAAEQVSFVCQETGDEYLRRTALAQLEGREGGWLGGSVADSLREKLAELEHNEDDECEVEHNFEDVGRGHLVCRACGAER